MAVARLDPLLWLVLVGSVGLLLPHLPWTVLPIVIAAFAWRRVHEVSGLPLPPRWLLLLLATASTAVVVLHFHALWGRDAGVALLVVAAGLKLLETHETRDQYGVLLLAFFLLISVLLFDQAIAIFALVMVLFWLLVGAWMGISQPAGPAGHHLGKRLRDAGRLLLLGLPFTLILFALFPRPPGALWGVQQPGGQAQTGLSEQMRPGQFDQLAEDPSPAFRVRFDGPPIPPEQRYWRVFVMSGFAEDDPESWIADPVAGSPRLETLDDSRVAYQITLEPTAARQLPSLAAAIDTPARSRVDGNLVVQRERPVDNRLRYRLTSALEYRLDVGTLPRFRRQHYLALGGLNPLLADLASSWHHQPPAARIDQALAYFREQSFEYTRSPGRRQGADRADTFLFETQRGYCADYADAFVRLMRAAGVPARVVTGYQGGELNGDYLVVRQSDAHAWAEVWTAADGWRRVDPTAAVAPERIEEGIAHSMADDANLPATVRRAEGSFGRQMRLLAEQMDNRWNQYVLGYDGRIQHEWLGRLGLAMSHPVWGALWALAVAVLVWWGLLVLFARRERRRQAGSEAEYLWMRLQDDLARLGIHRDNPESERALLRRAATALPFAGEDLRRVGQLLEATRYARSPSRRQSALLTTRLENLHRRLFWRGRWPLRRP
ncbi:transglutaminaseTgpA domain-containing protein [Guyparkeria halopsychrophila]|uniref:transglutaminase TgpA family protein n=1 Tax=Guyparkeria halopsychrophila TaxID=3139421 RepID=UPI0037C831B5